MRPLWLVVNKYRNIPGVSWNILEYPGISNCGQWPQVRLILWSFQMYNFYFKWYWKIAGSESYFLNILKISKPCPLLRSHWMLMRWWSWHQMKMTQRTSLPYTCLILLSVLSRKGYVKNNSGLRQPCASCHAYPAIPPAHAWNYFIIMVNFQWIPGKWIQKQNWILCHVHNYLLN